MAPMILESPYAVPQTEIDRLKAAEDNYLVAIGNLATMSRELAEDNARLTAELLQEKAIKAQLLRLLEAIKWNVDEMKQTNFSPENFHAIENLYQAAIQAADLRKE